jgi:ribosomal protein S6--L-glutamate ligase
MTSFILLSTEKDNWAPKQIIAKAEEKGIKVDVINPDTAFISLVPEPFIMHDGKKLESSDFCITRLSEDNLEYKVAIINQIEKMGIPVLNSGKSMRNASNKVETQILLNDIGLHTPKTVAFTCEDQLEQAIEAIGGQFPIIIKTLFGTHGIGVIKADSYSSAHSIIQQLLKSEEQFVIQEYIDHKESGRILMLDGEVVASVMRTVPENSFRSNAHLGAELKIHEATEKEIEACKKAVEKLDINFAAVDYIMHEDEVLILEVNGSPGFEAMQKVVKDKDIAEVLVDFCLSKIDKQPEEENKEVETVSSATSEISVEVESGEVEVPKVDEKPEEEVIVPIPNVEGDNVVGSITQVVVKFFNNNEPIEARVDTGATLSSIHGENIIVNNGTISFVFNGVKYRCALAKTTKIKQAATKEDGPEERPVIRVDMVIDGVELKGVELTVSDREHMKYDLLLGRETLAQGGFLVNPAVGLIDKDVYTNNTNSKSEEE